MLRVWFVSHLLSMLGFGLAVIFMARVLRERRAPSSTLGWLLIIALAPYVGVPLYLVFGGRKLRPRATGKAKPTLPDVAARAAGPLGPVEAMVRSMGGAGATAGNRVQLLSTGEGAYGALLDMIRGAKRSIHVAMFLLGRDKVGQAVLEELTKKAAEGVEVRLLLDALFAFRTSRRGLSALRRAGGQVAFFMPLLHLPFRGHANLRNHRKIVVVDGEQGFVGGMNIAEEYMGPTTVPGRWLDVAMHIEGPAVEQVAAIFQADWDVATGTSTPWLAAATRRRESAGAATVQVVVSGPDVPDDAFFDALLTALFASRMRVWIATPYFVPDESLARALVLAARRGVDVRLLVPARSNHLAADIAGGSYLRQIQDAGGRIYRYGGGMMHAKVTVIDDVVATLGSANMDIRSLFLDYEVSLFFYSRVEIELLVGWYEGVLRACTERLPQAGRSRALAEDVGRLLAPLV